MRPRPRLRKTAKWAGVVVCAVIAGAFVVTLKWLFEVVSLDHPPSSWGSRRCGVRVFHGAVICSYDASVALGDPYNGVWFKQFDWGVDWSPRLVRAPGQFDIRLPLWIPFLLFAIPTALLWRRDHVITRRARAGRCPGCGYELAGLGAGSACPECGKIAVGCSATLRSCRRG